MIIIFRLFLVTLIVPYLFFSHCQIPCGIYSDANADYPNSRRPQYN